MKGCYSIFRHLAKQNIFKKGEGRESFGMERISILANDLGNFITA